MIEEGDAVFCKKCREFGPAATEDWFVPTQPDRHGTDTICSHCGATEIVTVSDYWDEIDAKGEAV